MKTISKLFILMLVTLSFQAFATGEGGPSESLCNGDAAAQAAALSLQDDDDDPAPGVPAAESLTCGGAGQPPC